MTETGPKANVNAATLILRVVESLMRSPAKQSIPRALAVSMPFRPNESYTDADAILDSSVRIATVINALRELAYIIEEAHVEKETARQAVGNLMETFKSMPRALDSNASWIQGTITGITITTLKHLAFHLPVDRPDTHEADTGELIVAIAALRALATDKRTPPNVKAELEKLVSALEGMILNSYFDGPNAVVDVLGRWKRHHDAFKAACNDASDLDQELAAELDKRYSDLVTKVRAYADDALRATGVASLVINVSAFLLR